MVCNQGTDFYLLVKNVFSFFIYFSFFFFSGCFKVGFFTNQRKSNIDSRRAHFLWVWFWTSRSFSNSIFFALFFFNFNFFIVWFGNYSSFVFSLFFCFFFRVYFYFFCGCICYYSFFRFTLWVIWWEFRVSNII